MSTNILMPALSPTMEKGNLAKWLKKVGDKVKSGDVIAEIETDKATMEVEAVDEGILAEILVPEGSMDVPVNQLIAVLAEEGEDVSAAKAAAPKPAAAPSPAPAAAAAPAAVSAPAPLAAAPAPAAKPAANGSAAPSAGAKRLFASPLARRIAKEAGIDLASVQGSGPHGRVVERDVKAALAGGTAKPAGAAPSAPAPRPASASSLPSDEQIKKFFEPGSYEEIPHDNMRRTIARRMTDSMQNIPHFFLTADCDLEALLRLREEANAGAPQIDGKPAYKLSVNDFVIKAMAMALHAIPDANVSYTEGALLKHKSADVGVAVAIPNGLITPIVRNAGRKSLSVISNEMRDFAARAKARKLQPTEYQGGTTAISNLGMYGVKHFTAVINPPHSTILAVGAGEQRAIVRNGKIEVGQMMSVTLSCDHRALDGALGAELLRAFVGYVERPTSMLV